MTFRNQKTIYISSQEIWDSIIKAAAGRSISSYLVELHEANVAKHEAVKSREDQIAAELEIVSGIPDSILKPGDNNSGYKETDSEDSRPS